MSDAFAKMVPLSEEQRNAALKAAREKIAGELILPTEPQLEDYNATDYSFLPGWFSFWVTLLSIFMLIVAFLPSAMRLHSIGLAHALAVLIDEPSSKVAAWCVVFMAEIGQVIFTLGALNAKSAMGKAGMYLGAAICTLIALAGNAQAVGTHATDGPFALLETYAPPILVLLTSSILKGQAISGVKARYDANAAYEADYKAWEKETQAAKRAWQDAFDNAPEHHSWQRVRAFALREALRRNNARSTAVLRELTDYDWHALVTREINADQWFDRAVAALPAPEPVRLDTLPAPETEEDTEEMRSVKHKRRSMPERAAAALPKRNQVSGGKAGKYTGELDDAVTQLEDGSFEAVCPICAKKFGGESFKSAKNSLVAHMKRHRNEAKNANATENASHE